MSENGWFRQHQRSVNVAHAHFDIDLSRTQQKLTIKYISNHLMRYIADIYHNLQHGAEEIGLKDQKLAG